MNRIIKDLLDGVNKTVNSLITYKEELKGEDLWQHPIETLALGTGDCEDIAIMKMMLLRGMVPKERLRLIYCTTGDTVPVPHMVLGYMSEQGILLLDNMSDIMVWAADTDYSTPVYFVDGFGRVFTGSGKISPARIAKFDALLRGD